MTKCPKCGGTSIAGPIYLKPDDLLLYTCVGCGFQRRTEPLDRQKLRAAVSRAGIKKKATP